MAQRGWCAVAPSRRHAHDVDVRGHGRVVHRERLEPAQGPEGRVVAPADGPPLFHEPRQLLELLQPHRGAEVRHVIAEARADHLVEIRTRVLVAVPGVLVDAEDAQAADLLGCRVVGQGYGAAFSGRDVLDGVEAEAGRMPVGPDLLPLIVGAESVGRVFDDEEIPRLGHGRQSVQIAGAAAVVDWHHRAGSGGQAALHVVDVDEERVLVGFGEDRGRALGEYSLDAGREGDGGDDDFVAGPDAEPRKGDVEGRGPGVHGDDVLDAQKLLEGFLELENGRSHPEPGGIEHLLHGQDLLRAGHGAGNGDHGKVFSCFFAWMTA